MIHYVPMEERHVEAIAELEKVCFSDPWSVNSIRYELTNRLSYWLVAESDGQVVGYVGSQSVIDAADMMNIAVSPDFRRMGTARELINRLIDALKDRQVCCLTLEVRASNAGAIALYEQMGFELAGIRPNYYHNPKEDAKIMRKEWHL